MTLKLIEVEKLFLKSHVFLRHTSRLIHHLELDGQCATFIDMIDLVIQDFGAHLNVQFNSYLPLPNNTFIAVFLSWEPVLFADLSAVKMFLLETNVFISGFNNEISATSSLCEAISRNAQSKH